jgi:hypothetical protein
MPRLRIDTEAIITRLRELASADMCERCELPAGHAIADIARLLVEVTRLYNALYDARLEAANLHAAIRAALGAYDDGEADPLVYLRDEIAGNPGGGAYGA